MGLDTKIKSCALNCDIDETALGRNILERELLDGKSEEE